MPSKKKSAKTVIAVSSAGRNKKFLDFAISTSNTNSGTQQYGAGQSIRSRNVSAKPDRKKDARRGRSTQGMEPSLGMNLGTLGHINQVTSELGVSLEPRCEVLQNADGTDFVLAASGIGFETRSFNINAGLKTLPWASGVFGGFEKYRVKDLKFEFVPTVSGFNGAGEAGTVVMLFNYDALEGPPNTMSNAMTYAPSVLTMPSVSALLEVDHKLCTPNTGKYVRSGPVAGDLKTYDAGTLHVCTEGIASTQEFGHILVYYTLEAIKARINPPALSYFPSAATLLCECAAFPNGALTVMGSPSSTGSWVRSPGTGANRPPDLGSLPIGLDSSTGMMHFPQGRYLCDWSWGFNLASSGVSIRVHVQGRTDGVDQWYYGLGPAALSATYALTSAAVCPLVVDDALGADVFIEVQVSAAGASSGVALLVVRHLTASLTY
jgi:hypothetical protein